MKKRYKWYWSPLYLGDSVPKQIAVLQVWLKSFTAALGTTAFFTDNVTAAACVVGAYWFLDLILQCTCIEEQV